MKEGEMMKICRLLLHSFLVIILTASANAFLWVKAEPRILFLLIPAVSAVHLVAGAFFQNIPKKRLRVCNHGAALLIVFLLSAGISVIFHTMLAFRLIPNDIGAWIWSAVFCIAMEAAVFWHGIICVYLTSAQLGIRYRVLGIVCGPIPIAQLIALGKILSVVYKEIRFESEKELLNEKRKEAKICQTKYPLLLVHGVFFRDSKLLNYWGRIPKELEKNGAQIYYGNHESAASVAKSAEELSARIKQIVSETGCGKLNVIAHSKGGLDMRYALSELGVAPYVASLTTVNTPHRGCLFVDTLLARAPDSLAERVANTYNASFLLLGDEHPDFMEAVNDLTASACQKRNAVLKTPDGIYYQSIGSVLSRASSGRFPLNVSYHLAQYFEGAHDGLVSEDSFAFGEHYTLLRAKGNRGISHGDMIDLNRENLEGFDVREFYVQRIAQLKQKGL